jgi:hypothetical protein
MGRFEQDGFGDPVDVMSAYLKKDNVAITTVCISGAKNSGSADVFYGSVRGL